MAFCASFCFHCIDMYNLSTLRNTDDRTRTCIDPLTVLPLRRRIRYICNSFTAFEVCRHASRLLRASLLYSVQARL